MNKQETLQNKMKQSRNGRKMKGNRMIAGILLVGILVFALTGCRNTDVSNEETEKPVI